MTNFNTAIEINKVYGLAYNNRGKIYNDYKLYTKSIKDFDKAIELNAQLCESYYFRGIAYKNQCEYKKAE